MIGHGAGYVGVIADQTGAGVIKAFGASTGAVNGLTGLGDTSAEGRVNPAHHWHIHLPNR